MSWDASTGATHYRIYYDDFVASSCRLGISGRPSFCDLLSSNVTGTSYTHTSPDGDFVNPGDNYYWVTACNSSGCSPIDSSNPASMGPGSTTTTTTTPTTTTTTTRPTTTTTLSQGDALTVVISTCKAQQSGISNFYDVQIGGTVTASRSVSNVTVTGYINGSWIGIDLLGSMRSGTSKSFFISGTSTSATTYSCRVSVEGVELG